MVLKHCASSKTSVISCHENISCTWIRLAINPSWLVAQLVERQSRTPKMRVQIPLETTNFSLYFAVSD